MKKFLGSLFVMAFALFLGCTSMPEWGYEESGKKAALDGVTPTHITIVRFVKVQPDGTTKILDKAENEVLAKVEVHTKGLKPETVMYLTPADGEASTGGLKVGQKKQGIFTLLPSETVNLGRVDAYFGDDEGHYSSIFDVPRLKWHGVATVLHDGQKGHLLRLVGALPAGPRRLRLIEGLGAPDVPSATDSDGNTTEVLVKPKEKKPSTNNTAPPSSPTNGKKKKGAYNG